jgi:hypothetical protein
MTVVVGDRCRRGLDRIAPAVVLSLGFVVAGCAASPSATNDGHLTGATSTTTSAPSHPSGSSTTTTPATAAPVAAGAVAARSAVPWSKLGPGWLLATWSQKATEVTGQGTGSATIFLVDPAGGRYDLGAAPAGRLVDWSGSGTDALFLELPAQGAAGATQVVVENLRTGSQHAFTPQTASTLFQVQFSKPEGEAVLVSGAPVRRYGLTGALEQTYPGSIPGAGTPSKASGEAVETPSGAEVVLQAADGLDVVTNAGAPVRFLPPPAGQSSCLLDGWWTGDDVLETCGGGALYGQPVGGGNASTVGQGATGGQYIDAWTVAGEVVAEAGACGTTWLVNVGADGTAQKVTVPGAGSVAGIGVAGRQLAALVTPNCDHPTGQAPKGNVLEWYTPSSGALRTVLGGSVGGGTVDAAVVEDDT